MRPNHEVIKKLMKDHVNLAELRYQMDMLGIKLPYIGGIDLFEIILDLIGFPEEDRKVWVPDEDGNEYEEFDRSKWTAEVHCLERDGDIEAVLEKLYAEYDELRLKQPRLFKQNADKTMFQK
jgi:hypothetical protein